MSKVEGGGVRLNLLHFVLLFFFEAFRVKVQELPPCCLILQVVQKKPVFFAKSEDSCD